MKKEVDPKTTNRAMAFELWMQSPMPMVTLVKTFDVSRLVRISRRHKLKFNMLMCWCIARAASSIQEFYLLPVDGKLMQYDSLAVDVIVQNKNGGLNYCDIPFDNDFAQFRDAYDCMTAKAVAECSDLSDDDRAVVGTSVVIATELDTIVNQWSGRFANPFLAWAKYRRGFFKTTLPISFQFHHTQMDGGEAAQFLNALQKEIDIFKFNV